MSQSEFKPGLIQQSRSLADTDVVGLFCMGTLSPLVVRKEEENFFSSTWYLLMLKVLCKSNNNSGGSLCPHSSCSSGQPVLL